MSYRFLAAILAITLLVVAAPVRADDALDAYNLSVEANQRLAEKRYEDGLKLVEKAIRLDPKNPYYRGQAGSLNWFLKQYPAGLLRCEEAIRLAEGKDDAWFLHMAGENAHGLQDFPRAKTYFQQALARGEKELGGNFAIARERLAALTDRTLEVEWVLHPDRAAIFKRPDGSFLIPLPSSTFPYQTLDRMTVTGAVSHKAEDFEGNEMLAIQPRGTDPVHVRFTVTLKPFSYREALAKYRKNAEIPAEAGKYLRKSEWIDPASPKLLEIVRELRREHPLETVDALLAWLRRRLTYVPGSTFRSAEDVLDQGRAVCFGWAAAFVALCRTAGIPARMVDVLNPNQFPDKLEFHTTCEVWIPGAGWIPVEPQPFGMVGVPGPGQIRLYHYAIQRNWEGRNAAEIHPLCTLKHLGVLNPKYTNAGK